MMIELASSITRARKKEQHVLTAKRGLDGCLGIYGRPFLFSNHLLTMFPRFLSFLLLSHLLMATSLHASARLDSAALAPPRRSASRIIDRSYIVKEITREIEVERSSLRARARQAAARGRLLPGQSSLSFALYIRPTSDPSDLSLRLQASATLFPSEPQQVKRCVCQHAPDRSLS